ncbi:MAG: hypothetical protein D3924_10635, partial [Candidatus Electrothrix sp. AR4]|nr:hypothetical protein [Candidatus Electrothrix sp. AR4]
MDNTHYKIVLIEKIIGWTDGILVVFLLIFIRECNLQGLEGINTFQHIVNTFQHIKFSVCDGCKLMVAFFLWNCIVHFTKITQLHVMENETWRELVSRTSISVTMGTSLVILFSYLSGFIQPNLSFISVISGISFWGILMILFILNKMSLAALLHWHRRRRQRRQPEELHHALIVGAGNIRAISLATNLRRPDSGYSFIGFVDDISDEIVKEEGGIENDEQLEEVKQYLKESLPIVCSLQEFELYISEHRMDEVFITLPIRSFYDQISTIIKACRQQGIKIRLLNDLFDFRKDFFSTFDEDTVSDYFHVPYVPDYLEENFSTALIDYDFINRSKSKEDLKRLFDLSASFLALIVLLPIFFIV